MSGSKRKNKRQNKNLRKPPPATHSSTTSPPGTPNKEESSRKVIASCCLVVLGIVSSLITVFAAPAFPALLISVAVLIIGRIVILARKRVTWFSKPELWGAALMIVGTSVFVPSLFGYLSDQNSAINLASQGTCAAAQDFREAWNAQYSVLGVTGSPVTVGPREQLNVPVQNTLASLTAIADRSSWQQGQRLVNNIRVDIDTSLEIQDNFAQSFWLQVKGWSAFNTLSDACKASGHSVLSTGYAVQPSIHEACLSFAQGLAAADYQPSGTASKSADIQNVTKVVTIFNKATFNGLNSNDQEFAKITYQFAVAFGDAFLEDDTPAAASQFGSAGVAIERACENRGLWPSVAS